MLLWLGTIIGGDAFYYKKRPEGFDPLISGGRVCIENDVHVLGISSLAAGHKTLIPKLIEILNEDENNILIIAGGVIPKKDYEFPYEKGVHDIFGPGTVIAYSAISILNRLLKS